MVVCVCVCVCECVCVCVQLWSTYGQSIFCVLVPRRRGRPTTDRCVQLSERLVSAVAYFSALRETSRISQHYVYITALNWSSIMPRGAGLSNNRCIFFPFLVPMASFLVGSSFFSLSFISNLFLYSRRFGTLRTCLKELMKLIRFFT